MLRDRCSHAHPAYVETPIEHEVRGPRAKVTVAHTYRGTYPDGCPAPESHRYHLVVDGEYLDSVVAGGSSGVPRRLLVFKEIAEAMNERVTDA